MTNYVIEQGIPIPPMQHKGRGVDPNSRRGTVARLGVGDSVFFPVTPQAANASIQSLRAQNKTLAFAVRPCDGGCRVWRVA